MPTLDWIGKKAVVNHHREVPYRLIHCDKDKSHGDPDAGNLLVQGDNLEALKALLPYYAGKVKCIYIDPPYNTGNESWVYNDNVNSPEIRAWLGSVVGKEAEDLSRHDKWLCMMYPRLRLLKEFLSEDGSIWISIDDNEVHGLKLILDEIFGRRNFISNVIWQKKYAPANDALWLSESHDHIVVYARSKNVWRPNKLARTEQANAAYKNPDSDPRGPWRPDNYTCAKTADERPNLYYPITNPNTLEEIWPSRSRVWGYGKEENARHIAEGLIWWGKNGNNKVPALKRFRDTLRSEGTNAQTIWLWDEVSHTQDGRKEQLSLLPDDPFPTPKPEKLVQRIIELASTEGDLILDSFAGSGTTGAVAHKLGRKHIGVEMGEHAVTHVVPRYSKVVDGEQGGISKAVNWTGGGGFRFCTLGEPLFDADGNVSPSVTFPDLAAHVFFCETGSPIPKRADGASPLIGTFQNRAIYLLHSAEAVGVAREQAGNVLTGTVLEALPLPEADFAGARIVYAEGCTVPDDRLSALGVTFKQIPYQIEGI
ncbi:site-specific DNA-methyltransferase [Rhizobium daejeonense]|uniref:site-specific DNA-methyltransferase (adenine-specific) n=1 Tax=Rhizobium daejeonense TaxID=240521 RepID=A0A6M1S1E6_9HYPH|nr:site-specific DNA-methyltransferase [Rhizobium daejeonense]NGO64935.1 site-specific DNA-methyltransferase [Rhizobium daejeonense]